MIYRPVPFCSILSRCARRARAQMSWTKGSAQFPGSRKKEKTAHGAAS